MAMPPMGEVRIDIDAARRALARQSLRDYAQYVVIRSDDPLHPAPTAMVPYPYQVELGERWEQRESMVVLKARQIGASVWLRAYAAWRAWAHGWAVGYYSRGQAEAIAWLDGVEAILRELPASWGVRTRRRGELLEVGEGSVRAHPSTASAGIGYTYQLVIADEAAHHEYGAANYDNYAPTLSAGGQYICLSTADPALGPAGWFHGMWQQASDGTLPYSAVFLPWSSRPGRDAAWYAAERARYQEERAFSANYPERPSDAFLGREGLVYPMADEARHCRPAPVPWEACEARYYSTDLGGGDPTAVLTAGVYRTVAGPRVHVYGCLYQPAGRGPLDVSEIGTYLTGWHSRARFRMGANDPAPGGGTVAASLGGLFGLPAQLARNRRAEGIELVQQYLSEGWITFEPDVWAGFAAEFGGYRWATRADPHSRERYDTSTPVDHHGDRLDALRYALMAMYYDQLNRSGRAPFTAVDLRR